MPDSWYCAVCRTRALPGNSYVTPTLIVHRGECLDRWLQNPQPHPTNDGRETGG